MSRLLLSTFMRFQIVSDLHLDFRIDKWKETCQIIIDKKDKADTLIIAGDLSESRNSVWGNSLRFFSDHYANVLVVLGNHEYYHYSQDLILKQIEHLPCNVQFLLTSELVIDDIKIAGCTLWFPASSKVKETQKQLSDFYVIPEFEEWVYEKHRNDIEFLKQTKADIIITHHGPHPKSIHPRYITSSLNHFFVNNLESVIKKCSAKYWIHGHTHSPHCYEINNTLILCNPLGYPNEQFVHDSRYPSCVYDIYPQSIES